VSAPLDPRLHHPACLKQYRPGVPLDLARCQRCRDLLEQVSKAHNSGVAHRRTLEDIEAAQGRAS
jgi:hypothetical protein